MLNDLDVPQRLVLRFSYVTGMNSDGSLAYSKEHEKGIFGNMREALGAYRGLDDKGRLYYARVVDSETNRIVRPL